MKKKSTVKADLKNYFIQFAIVAAGVLVTFIGSALITRCSTQKEIKSAMHLIIEELEENSVRLKKISVRMESEARIATYLNNCDYDYTQLPADTLNEYRFFTSSLTSFEYLSDALEVLKSSSLIQSIPDKKLILDIIRSYENLRMVQANIGNYFHLKQSIIQPIVINISPEERTHIKTSVKRPEEVPFALVLSNPGMKNFCQTAPQFLDSDFLPRTSRQVNESLALLKKKYR